MRRPLLGLAIVLGISLLVPAGRAHAQQGVGADPFSFYYGYYLPHAAAIAAQPTPLDTLNNITAQRQFNAVTDRARLYDPISPYGTDDELDPSQPYAPRRGGERRATRVVNHALTPAGSPLARGGGPALYFNRTATYYPTMRVGRGPNRNLAISKGARGGGGGMPGGMGGFAGPR